MSRASSVLFWFALTLLVSLGLYHTSYRVDELDRTLRSLNAKIAAEQRSLHVLRAEYVYLTNPARIEIATRKYLTALEPTAPKQIVRLTKLAALLPTRGESMGTAMVEATPIASLRPQTAAHTPKAGADENLHLNTRLVIRKTASAQPLPYDDSSPVLSTSADNAPIAAEEEDIAP